MSFTHFTLNITRNLYLNLCTFTFTNGNALITARNMQTTRNTVFGISLSLIRNVQKKHFGVEASCEHAMPQPKRQIYLIFFLYCLFKSLQRKLLMSGVCVPCGPLWGVKSEQGLRFDANFFVNRVEDLTRRWWPQAIWNFLHLCTQNECERQLRVLLLIDSFTDGVLWEANSQGFAVNSY